jgi:hypothetical protein
MARRTDEELAQELERARSDTDELRTLAIYAPDAESWAELRMRAAQAETRAVQLAYERLWRGFGGAGAK